MASPFLLHPIVFILSVSCEQILMSPQFHSAIAAFACRLPAYKDTLLANILSLSPPWLITVLVPSLPPSFSHLFYYFFIFSASRKKVKKKKKLILSFFIIWQSPYSVLLSYSLSALPLLHKLQVNISLFQHRLGSYFLCAHILCLFTQSGSKFHHCSNSRSSHSRSN